jgi:hypothetical protein
MSRSYFKVRATWKRLPGQENFSQSAHRNATCVSWLYIFIFYHLQHQTHMRHSRALFASTFSNGPRSGSISFDDGIMLSTNTDILPADTGTDQPLDTLGAFRLLHPPRLVRDVLLVEPDPQMLTKLERAIDESASVVACRTFKEARAALRTYAPMLLVTNLRLDGYNGLHLVLLTSQFGTRSVVYVTKSSDPGIAREVRRFGAFYETEAHLLRSLPAYVHGCLPDSDRRDRPGSDRRCFPRGGRRAADDAPTHFSSDMS